MLKLDDRDLRILSALATEGRMREGRPRPQAST